MRQLLLFNEFQVNDKVCLLNDMLLPTTPRGSTGIVTRVYREEFGRKPAMLVKFGKNSFWCPKTYFKLRS